jgi:hypothetical protein
MLNTTKTTKVDKYDCIPQSLYDIQVPFQCLLHLGELVDFQKSNFSAYEKIILDTLLTIIKCNESELSKRINICFFLDGMYPVQ